MNLDILFIDTVSPYFYDSSTLDTQGLGGTEATVIRVSEALGLAGFKVGVINHKLEREHIGHNVYFLPLSYLQTVKAKYVVGIRSLKYVPNFAGSLKFVWHHDLVHKDMLESVPALIKHDIQVIGVSKWHQHHITDSICNRDETLNPIVKYVYNPVQDNIFVPRGISIDYDKNKLVWLSSPHKGLTNAIESFRRLKAVSENPKFELHVFNPGYLPTDYIDEPGLKIYGSVPPSTIWEHASTSLCVFYPSEWKETFGLIAAEANAVRCPVAAYEQAGLVEVLTPTQLVTLKDEKALIDKVISWYSGNRPNVYGNKKFKLSEVTLDWIRILTRRQHASTEPSHRI